MRNELNAIFTIAFRDLTKLLRDRARIIVSLIFPLIFIGGLGASLQANLGAQAGYNLLTFVFTGVFGQVLFQSTATGIISLIEDRENDFSQEIFISPVSRFSIIIGKVLGESLVSYVQVLGVIVFGLLVGVQFTPLQVVSILIAGIFACLIGGSFGTLVLSTMSNQRAANQIFPLLIFPQFVLAGVFNPIKDLPPVQLVLSRISPMTYAVDFIRNVFYLGTPELKQVTILPLWADFIIIVISSAIMITIGTVMFTKSERNR